MNNWITFHRRLFHFSLSYSETTFKLKKIKNYFYERGYKFQQWPFWLGKIWLRVWMSCSAHSPFVCDQWPTLLLAVYICPSNNSNHNYNFFSVQVAVLRPFHLTHWTLWIILCISYHHLHFAIEGSEVKRRVNLPKIRELRKRWKGRLGSGKNDVLKCTRNRTGMYPWSATYECPSAKNISQVEMK